MNMSESHFIRRVPKRPWRRWSAAKDRHPPSTRFVHRVVVRPARFRLVPGVDPNWDGGPVLDHIEAAAMRRAFYVGRVVEFDDERCAVLVELWEIPSGRAMVVWLPADERLEGQTPAVGDQLNLWTWTELPGAGAVVPRYHGQVMRRSLSDEDRADLQRVLAGATMQPREDET